jgi:hypothetical protein
MNYDLAMELKEAGFPQPDLLPVNGVQRLYGLGKGDWKSKNGGAIMYAPTLEELIESCGSGGFELRRAIGYGSHADYAWKATLFAPKRSMIGTTPTEAVAKLWITLNKQHDA